MCRWLIWCGLILFVFILGSRWWLGCGRLYGVVVMCLI